MARGKIMVSQVEFITAWETSNTVKEVMEKTGMNYNAVIGRVNGYRKPRVADDGTVLREALPLKEMGNAQRKSRVNVSELTALIMELRQKQNATQPPAVVVPPVEGVANHEMTTVNAG
jgi:hypothetical protein